MRELRTCVIFDTPVGRARGLEVGLFGRRDAAERVRDELADAGFVARLISEDEEV